MGNSNAMLDNAIGRLDAIVDGANSGDAGQVLEQYSYLGLSTIVARNHPQTGINLTLVGSSGSIGSGGDQYVGLDRFGRIVNQNWVNSSGTTVDGYTYSYDSNSNVTAKNNTLDSAYNETYTYDSLNRLTAVTRGGASYQSWNLDAQGNWSGFTSNGTAQTRTANAQNQITSITGTSATPTYDAAGNMISDQNGDTLVYDAWNRLVEVKNSAGAVVAQYTYNAQGYAVTATYPQGTSQLPPGTTNYLYYTSSWQLIEVRTGGTAAANVTVQMVWSAAYINAPVLQDTYSAGVIQPNYRLYFIQDANWNTTAAIGYDAATGTWNVVQRYVYSPYGNIIILNPNFTTTPAGTIPMVNNLYQGMPLDPVTGLYYERARWYSPSLGTWISQDPAGYINGADTYQFVGDGPVGRVDPWGLFSIYGGVYAAASGSVDLMTGNVSLGGWIWAGIGAQFGTRWWGWSFYTQGTLLHHRFGFLDWLPKGKCACHAKGNWWRSGPGFFKELNPGKNSFSIGPVEVGALLLVNTGSDRATLEGVLVWKAVNDLPAGWAIVKALHFLHIHAAVDVIGTFSFEICPRKGGGITSDKAVGSLSLALEAGHAPGSVAGRAP